MVQGIGKLCHRSSRADDIADTVCDYWGYLGVVNKYASEGKVMESFRLARFNVKIATRSLFESYPAKAPTGTTTRPISASLLHDLDLSLLSSFRLKLI